VTKLHLVFTKLLATSFSLKKSTLATLTIKFLNKDYFLHLDIKNKRSNAMKPFLDPLWVKKLGTKSYQPCYVWVSQNVSELPQHQLTDFSMDWTSFLTFSPVFSFN